MNTSSKNFMFISLSIGCALILLFVAIALAFVVVPLSREYATHEVIHNERVNRLRILLCEDIKLGMTKEQVINSLAQKGEIGIMGNYDESNVNLVFMYMEPPRQNDYGHFNIMIRDNKYVGSYISTGFESYEIICSLD